MTIRKAFALVALVYLALAFIVLFAGAPSAHDNGAHSHAGVWHIHN